ncbi:MAG: TIGR00296 family protein [Candidatus Marsarchaeota archaeon]|nr:TIGR00296 family protein [Candidatus Marsarchaeota archaeon]
MKIYTLEQGKELVKAARSTIELAARSPRFKRELVRSSLKSFDEKYGVFVTLKHYPTETLRGCIGFPKPVESVRMELVDAAFAAAFEDPRFVPVSHKELDELIVEVSILSEPIAVKSRSPAGLRRLKIGRDGVIIEYGLYSGLLLPEVAVEQKWDREQLLDGACEKAGLPTGYWKQPNVKLYKFETQVFTEETPSGNVVELK